MALRKYRLGELIALIDRRNASGQYGLDDVRGVNNLKLMIRTKADVSARDLTKFQIVNPGEFFFNHRTSRNGSKFSITYNYDDVPRIVTEDYVLFDISRDDVLDSTWLYLYFCRAEFDRYVIQNSWGSSTEFYNWEDLCDVEIELPPLDIQRKYVAIYESMLKNQRAYEQGLDDLKLSYHAQFDAIKHSAPHVPLRNFVTEVDARNAQGRCKTASGINLSKRFMPSVASSSDLLRYKLVDKGEIACNLLHVGRDAAYPIAINNTDEPLAVSPAYFVFKTSNAIDDDYFMAWFSRDEVGRNGWFICDDSIRGSLAVNRLLDVTIPLPSLQVQRSIVDLYKAYTLRSEINERLKCQLKDICPVLIKGSIEEASR